ncbi:hypothetical protein [Ochrovirga pacifica]|uniref:hypothetical protein n=1 Tax=Ochrovirga pacifica TaxID=1042376 RepID=UPI000255A2DE|nr:hypothetical protein [Ochrovirga pacifica]
MKKLLAKLGVKSFLNFNQNGIEVVNTDSERFFVDWDKIEKVVFVGYFEEYSGYFLTNDYKSKELYNDIFIDCAQNQVKIRTGSTPVVKRNTSDSFTTKHGTTCIYDAVFVEYRTKDGKLDLYAQHYNKNKVKEVKTELEKHLANKVYQFTRLDGFNHISSVK